jgi:hypothetical protein
MGDPDEAEHLIFELAPYFTPISKEHYQLRLDAHQEGLGERFCVVGVEAFSPLAHTFSRSQLKQFKQGDFSPLSARVLRVVDTVGPSDDQTVSIGGPSLGGDVSIQTAHDATYDENRGSVKITGLKAIEPARIDNRGALKAAKAFGDSGNMFYENVAASNSDELLKAFGIDGIDNPKKSERKLNSRALFGILGYLASAPLANKAIMQGFGTDDSLTQLEHILRDAAVPAVLAGVSENSTVSSPEINQLFVHWFGPDYIAITIGDNDHSADDNIRESAKRQAQFGEMIVSASEAS